MTRQSAHLDGWRQVSNRAKNDLSSYNCLILNALSFDNMNRVVTIKKLPKGVISVHAFLLGNSSLD